MSFGVQWESICDICGAPLNVSVHTESSTILSRIVTYSRSQPLNLTLNKIHYKSNIQRKCTRICESCNLNMHEVSIEDLHRREISGASNLKKHHSVSMSDLHNWFRRANRCIQDDDCNWNVFFENTGPFMKNVRLFIDDVEMVIPN